MGYRLNRLFEPVLITVSKPLLTEFGIHLRLESCELTKKITVHAIRVTCLRQAETVGSLRVLGNGVQG